jgi:hypothetical protein
MFLVLASSVIVSQLKAYSFESEIEINKNFIQEYILNSHFILDAIIKV